MSFHEAAVFPEGIAARSAAGPGWKTEVVRLRSKAEQRSQPWEQPTYKFDIAPGIKSWDDLLAVKAFFMARRGGTFGFRMKDWMDYTTATDGRSDPTDTDVLIGVGDGITKTFQLIKTYSDSGEQLDFVLEKPVSGTVVVSLDDVSQGSGWTVDTTNGVVTFTAAPGSGVDVKAGCKFHIPVRFDLETDEWLRLTAVAFLSGELPPILLESVPGETAAPERYNYGGAISEVLSAAKSLTLGSARVQNLDPGASARDVLLPNLTGVPGGFPFFVIKHAGAAGTLPIKTNLGSLIVTLSPGDFVMMAHLVNTDGTKVWAALE